jgi:hypothetical protein
MSAIPCASVNLADGTLRIAFDFEPKDAQDAFRLFAAPGTPAAIAALMVGYEAKSPNIKSYPEKDNSRPKGGALSKLAAMWCASPEFQTWSKTNSVAEARIFMLQACEIDGRAELDHNPEAAEKFQRHIRGPYVKYLQARGPV